MEFFENFDLNYILSTYGYLGILVLTFLEGETVVIIAGAFAYNGKLDPVLVAVTAFTGTFFSDQIMFSLGKYKGQSVLKRFPRINAKVDRASHLIKKYDILLILGFRFVYGVRNVTPIMLGISGVSHLKFFALNLIGAAVWAASFTAAGFYGAKTFETALHKFGHAVFYVLVAVAAVGGIVWFIRYRSGKPSLEALAQKGRKAIARRQAGSDTSANENMPPADNGPDQTSPAPAPTSEKAPDESPATKEQ